jgi:hypothetical protein
VPPPKAHLLARCVTALYIKYKWSSKKERKFSQLSDSQRLEFAEDARALCDAHADIGIHAIVVKKENVLHHIRQDANKLYNYMIKLVSCN